MSDKEQIIAELENLIKDNDPEEQGLPRAICNEVLEKAYGGSTEAMSELLMAMVHSTINRFDQAYSKLVARMGL